MRFLFFTDTHIRGTTPINRKDDFLSTLERKFSEISKIIHDNDVDIVLHGGDLFDKPDTSISIVSRFAKILMQFERPIYMISGNHDVFGHNPDTINRSILGLLEKVQLLRIITQGEKIIIEKNGTRVQLTGQPYIYDIDSGLKRDYYILKDVEEDVDYSIHMVHGMLLDRPFIKGVPYTLVEDINSTCADFTFAGHYHSGFKTIEHEGKYFINPGSIARISNSMRELERRPKVVLLDLKESIDIKYIYLSCAEDGHDVLDRAEIEKNIYKREQLYEFKQTIDATLNFEKMDINDVLIEVSNSDNIEDNVRIEALKRIAAIQMKGLNKD